MGCSKVAVIRVGQDVSEAVNRGVELIGGLSLKKNGKVVIKPNVCNPKNPYGMVLTDPRILEAAVNLVKKRTSDIVVVESDNISGTAEKRLADSGVLKLLETLDVDFLNLSKDRSAIYEVAGMEIRLPKTVLEADYFINLPKMKTEAHVLVTLSIKNLFGVLQRAKKSSLHRHLNDILPFLAKHVENDLIIVDGMTAMEGNGPIIGTPKNVGLIVAGSNPVAVDSACCRIMGFEPGEVAYLLRASEMGLGDLDNIEVVGDFDECPSYSFERPFSLKASIKCLRSIGKIYLSR